MSSVFYIYIAHEEKIYKLIDGGSCENIIAMTTLEKMDLKAELYPTHTT